MDIEVGMVKSSRIEVVRASGLRGLGFWVESVLVDLMEQGETIFHSICGV